MQGKNKKIIPKTKPHFSIQNTINSQKDGRRRAKNQPWIPRFLPQQHRVQGQHDLPPWLDIALKIFDSLFLKNENVPLETPQRNAKRPNLPFPTIFQRQTWIAKNDNEKRKTLENSYPLRHRVIEHFDSVRSTAKKTNIFFLKAREYSHLELGPNQLHGKSQFTGSPWTRNFHSCLARNQRGLKNNNTTGQQNFRQFREKRRKSSRSSRFGKTRGRSGNSKSQRPMTSRG